MTREKRPVIMAIHPDDMHHSHRELYVKKTAMGFKDLKISRPGNCFDKPYCSGQIYVSGSWRTFRFVRLSHIPKKFKI